MDHPDVSVLMPFRNAALTLDEAVASVLSQQGPAFELLAVDDHSEDDGAERVRAWQSRDARVRLLRSPSRGIVAALEHAASQAVGTFLARMDADDVTLPERFAAQVRALAGNAQLGAVATQVEAFPADAVGEGLRRYLAWQNAIVSAADHAREIFVESPFCHPSAMLRRNAFEQAGRYRDVPWPEDYDLWLRLDRAGFALAKVPGVYLRWRIRPGQLTFIDPRYAIERFLDAKAEHLGPRIDSMGRPFAIWGAGPTGRRLARALERHGRRPARFVDIDPRKIGRVARGVPIVAPDVLDRARESVLVAVGARGARDLVRASLQDRGWDDGRDFLCAS